MIPPFGNVPLQSLVDAVEKHVSKVDDAELAASLTTQLPAMPNSSLLALTESIFDAFRDRGESSEDAAEGANTTLDSLERGDVQAVGALLGYARQNSGVLKEALTIFAEHHGTHISALPSTLLDGVAGRLAF